MSKDERVFAALSEGGQVRMPLGKTFFSRRFGMLRIASASCGWFSWRREAGAAKEHSPSEDQLGERGPCYVPSRTRDSSLKPRPNPRQMSVLRLL